MVEHEVLPSRRRERTAITVWLYGRVVRGGGDIVGGAPRRDEGNVVGNAAAATAASGGNEVRSPAYTTLTIEEAAERGARTVIAGTSSAPPPLPLPPPPRRSPADGDDDGPQRKRRPRIFVAIPAYRDPEAHPTVMSLLSAALHPDRVHVGIVYQLDTSPSNSDSRCFLPPLPAAWARTNFRSLTLDHRSAAGPCPARAMAQCLLEDEEYVLQIDSHMRFRLHWDEYLIGQMGKCDRPERSALTTYPPGYALVVGGGSGGSASGGRGRRVEATEAAVDPDRGGTILDPWKFDEDGALRQKGRRLPAHGDDDRPIPCPLYAAGFAFLPSSALRDVPYDHSLRHLFFGEEMSMAVRLYTHGYDLYAPGREVVCYHLWSRDHRRTLRSDLLGVPASAAAAAEHGESIRGGEDGGGNGEIEAVPVAAADEARDRSRSVVRAQLLGVPGARGLGTERSAAEFAALVGADFASGTLISPAGGADGGGDGDGDGDVTSFLSRLSLSSAASPATGGIGPTDSNVSGPRRRKFSAIDGGGDGAVAKEVMSLVAGFLGN
mmetsp:Transcript_38482/g.115422  ORF Transcript_38482/g.115422 Transcript_38482/m.115422 type:complete len:549 (-) Transcript_38482:761-2407(-)